MSGRAQIFSLLLMLVVCRPALSLGVENYNGSDAASVQAFFSHKGLMTTESVTFLAVDGQQISGLRGQDTYSASLRLRPGQHDFAVQYIGRKGFTIKAWVADLMLRATLKPGGAYRLAATRDGVLTRVWIEDAIAHEHVSTIISASTPIVRKGDTPGTAKN